MIAGAGRDVNHRHDTSHYHAYHTAFCEQTDIDAAKLADILARHGAAWTQHRCDRIARYAAHYAQMIQSALPDCVVGPYMRPWMPEEFDGAFRRIFAQDYALLAQTIDVFTPLIYGTKSG